MLKKLNKSVLIGILIFTGGCHYFSPRVLDLDTKHLCLTYLFCLQEPCRDHDCLCDINHERFANIRQSWIVNHFKKDSSIDVGVVIKNANYRYLNSYKNFIEKDSTNELIVTHKFNKQEDYVTFHLNSHLKIRREKIRLWEEAIPKKH